MRKLWFARKTFGWGWTPVAWQGWVIVALYVIGLVKIVILVDATSHSISDSLFAIAVPFVALTSLLIFICYVTGEKPYWQWGNKNKPENKE